MWAWLAAEVGLTVAILRMNRKLFPIGDEVTSGPLWRLVAILAVVFGAAIYPAFRAVQEPLTTIVLVALVYTAATRLLCYEVLPEFLEVARVVLLSRWRARAGGAAPVDYCRILSARGTPQPPSL